LFGAWCAHEITTFHPAIKTVLDIGTGTGLLALMLSQKHNVYIDAVEIDAAAAAQAQQNSRASPWSENITVRHADILNVDFSKCYDSVISNPPFYENELQSPDARRNTAHHSRQLTLQALIKCIARLLKQTGCFFLLLHYKRRHELHGLLHQHGMFLSKEVIVRHTEHHEPFRIMFKGSRIQKESESTAISIAGNNQQYTPEFIKLLKDYYLYL
jgi:tRNA1Val (adenine37-N6)-methyltransferase